ncbi:MAG: hypothetical protein WBC51_13045 [Vicinamibacterales bacterium]
MQFPRGTSLAVRLWTDSHAEARMKRKMFATAVVLIVMATPLFGAQAAPAAKPAQGAPAAKPADKSQDKSQVAVKTAPAPAAAAASKKAPTPPAAPTARVVAISKAAPAAAKGSEAAQAKAAAPAAKPAKAAPAASSSTAVVKPGTVALSPVQEKLRASKELTTDVQAKVPGADVIEAAGGFTDLHLFVSAAYASHNLGVKFDALKAKLLSGKRTSLRQAIQELRPASSAAVEAQRAQYDAAGAISAAQRAATEAAANAATKSDKPATAKTTPKPKPSTTQQ